MENLGQRRIFLRLDYDGSGFAGWQVQPGEITIQETLEDALAKVTKEKVRIHGAGRTDAGVHAQGQAAHFDTSSSLPKEAIMAKANRILPPQIRIWETLETTSEFHARYSATGKIYRYLAWTGRQRSPYLQTRTGWFPGTREVPLIKEGAAKLIGTHDFRALAAAGRPITNAVRTIKRLDVFQPEKDLVVFVVEGDGFLYRMVRNLVGTLMEVGRGRFNPKDISKILKGKDRDQAGPTAPPEGLCLVQVIYQDLAGFKSQKN